ncbi:hypothetical protein EDM80_01915 [bacterium]|nr:MAG: hypothetical protein EDM80_01915 [bacterium]RIK64910.1 MAG: hypothetical protein DCC64_02205 [Planctomycetota bacterium]
MSRTTGQLQGYRAGELDLLGVLETAIAQNPRLLKGGLPNLAFFKAANDALLEPDSADDGRGFPQVEFWLALSRGAGLVAARDGRLEPTAAADRFFALPFEQRRAELREAWLTCTELNELTFAPDLELPGLKKLRTVDVVSDVPPPQRVQDMRRGVVRLLREISAETALSSLLTLAEARLRDVLIDHSDDASWRHVFYRGIRERGAAEDLERAGRWRKVEGAFIRVLCELPLSRLGYLAWDSSRAVLEPLDEPVPEGAAEIVVQPNFEVVVLGETPDTAKVWRLARFTEPVPGRRVRKYQLEKKRFAEALGRGQNAQDLVALLAAMSRTPLPQNVKFSLDDWGQLTERIRIWPDALFVEAEGVENLSDTLPAALVEKLGLVPLGGGHRACPAPDIAALRALMPARRALFDYSRALPRVMRPAKGLEIEAPRETLHFRARQVLALLTRQEGADRYLLDPEKVARAAPGLGARELRGRLEGALTEELSPQLALALRSWSGEFGSVFVGQAELLLCDDIDQARALALQPEFSAWVERQLSTTAFLLRPGAGERVRAFLKLLGPGTVRSSLAGRAKP